VKEERYRSLDHAGSISWWKRSKKWILGAACQVLC
jgi:hypothetical protein